MALLDGDLRDWLLEQPAIAALVVARLFLVRYHQNDPVPAIVLSQVTERRATHMRGYSRSSARRVQMDLYVSNPEELEAFQKAVADVLEGFTGWMGETRVHGAFLLSSRDLDEPDVDIYRRSLDWEIRVQRG